MDSKHDERQRKIKAAGLVETDEQRELRERILASIPERRSPLLDWFMPRPAETAIGEGER